MSGKKKKIIGLVGTFIAGLFIIFSIFVKNVHIGHILLENPLEPQIVKGRFPFTLTYEMKGKKMVVKDTLICQYDGIGINEGQGKFRKWKASLENGDNVITLWKGVNEKGTKQEIYYNYAPPGYYMGDPNYKDANSANYSDIILKSNFKDSVTESFISEDKLLKKYNIKIISWECGMPIKNHFE